MDIHSNIYIYTPVYMRKMYTQADSHQSQRCLRCLKIKSKHVLPVTSEKVRSSKAYNTRYTQLHLEKNKTSSTR